MLATWRSSRAKRAARKACGRAERRGKFHDVLTISSQPAQVEGRAVHWTLGRRPHSGCPRHQRMISTLVEGSPLRFTILLYLPTDHKAESVATAMIEAMRRATGPSAAAST